MALRKMSDAPNRSAMILFVLIAVPLGVLVGGIYYLVAQLVPLIMVDTFISALVALAVMAVLQRKAAIAKPILALMFALIFSVVIYVTYRYLNYQWFRTDAVRYLQTTYQLGSAATVQKLEAWLLENTGHRGLVGYLVLQAQEGIGLTPLIGYQGIVAPLGTGFRLTGVLVWLFWLLEFLVIVGLLSWLGPASAKYPFASAGVSRLGNQLGTVPLAQSDEFVHRLQIEDFDAAWALINFGEEDSHPTVVVYAHQNHNKTEARSLLLIARTRFDEKGQVRRDELFWTEVPNNKIPSQTPS